MTRSIPWLRVFVEGVVIVGSILLAFVIDAAWDRRGEIVEEGEILTGLRAHFEEVQARLDLWVGIYRVGEDLTARGHTQRISIPSRASKRAAAKPARSRPLRQPTWPRVRSRRLPAWENWMTSSS